MSFETLTGIPRGLIAIVGGGNVVVVMGTVAAGSSTVEVVVGCADVVVEMIVGAVWVVVVTEAVDVDAGAGVACTASVSRVRITSASSAAHAVMYQVQQRTRAHPKRGRSAGTKLEVTGKNRTCLVNRVDLICHVCNHLREICRGCPSNGMSG